MSALGRTSERGCRTRTTNENCTASESWTRTKYTYDALGNLTNALQNGSHQRTFTYDSLSRLTASNNPEVGAITYKYDSDTSCSGSNSFPGLLVSKVDARGIRTCAQYDALNRQTSLNYSNGDTTVTTTYDQSTCLGLSSCDNVGHRTSMTDAAGSEAWSYQVDPSNHRSVHVDQRTTSGIGKTSTYYLDLAGNVTQAVYPTGRTVNYTYDTADRPITAADASNGITYATGFQTSPGGTCITNVTCYAPQGSLYAVSIGQTSTFTGLNVTDSYNTRLQPNEFKASSTGGSAIDITYSFADPVTTKNAGHVYSISNNLDTTRSQTFTYDQLNRIITAQTTSTHATSPTHCWAETYTLDAWANLQTIAQTTNSNYTGCTQESGFTTTADASNHISAFGYDASGNATTEGTLSYGWNAESQLKSAAGVNYLYDGDGRRVSKSNGKLYWYGAGSEILAETDASGNTLNEYVFFGGKRIALLPVGSTAQFYVEDSLGTSRVVTTNTGVVCYDADFYPFGGERSYTNSCSQNNYKFEGKERDTETGNDDFGARYYSNRFGRWLSVDWSAIPIAVPYANLSNPQTLNLYAMVADDPESFADLDGHGDPQNDPARPPTPTMVCREDGCHVEPNTPAQNLNPQTEANIGIAKELVNSVTGLINLLGDASALLLGTGTPAKIPELAPSNDFQKVAMATTSVLLFAIPGTGEAKAPEAVKLAKSLASEAQVAGAAEKVIAGAGGPKALRQAERLASEYGGKPAEWSKMSSGAYRAADGSVISTHWYQQVGSVIKYELKSIIDSAPWSKPF